MADLIHFPHLFGGDFAALSPDHVAKFAQQSALRGWHRNPCANGMPGHPPCRSPAELERLLAHREARAVLADHVGVLDSLTAEQRSVIAGHDGPITIGHTTACREVG